VKDILLLYVAPLSLGETCMSVVSFPKNSNARLP
jgi:hypothetical protein